MDDESNVLLQATTDSTQPAKFSRAALVSFVCANLTLIGLLLGRLAPGVVYLFLAFVPAVIAGHIARRHFRKEPGLYRNESMARYGLAVGYLGLFLSVFVIAAMIFGLVQSPAST